MIAQVAVNNPYITVIFSRNDVEFYLVAERCIISELSNIYKAVFCLIAIFFVFNMSYPSPMKHVLIFIQHMILGLVDKEKPSPLVVKVHSSIHALA